MTLTPEQFNKIALKEDLKDLATKKEMNEKFDEVFTVMDSIVKKLDNIENNFLSNQIAHDRFEQRITKLEKIPL